jgi:putative spermidine/putrescine transport system ATP-binding protein
VARVELRELRRRFGNVVALDGLSLDVASGEFVSLLGPSGCGKTTALRIVAGFEWADSGAVLVDGVDITGLPANKRNMGMVFQAYSLFPNMTALENVEFGLRVRRKSRAERRQRAQELLELVDLPTQADRYPNQLSGGQQQRVALARALAIEPEVLLLDEPLSALDAKVRVQLRAEVRRIQRELGITTLYVTHDQEEALSISDRVAVMNAGRIEHVGTPAEVYESPRTAFTATFVGTMNRLDAEVVSLSDRRVRCGSVELTLADGVELGRVGEKMTVYLRPEDVKVSELEAGAQLPPGSFGGTVAATTFLGPVTRVSLETPLGTLLADAPSTARRQFSVGERVAVEINSGAIRTLAS